jgi:hypothetical protein
MVKSSMGLQSVNKAGLSASVKVHLFIVHT